MTFVLNQNWRLVISSVFVLGFATFISSFSKASNQEVLAGSAAYAAVLVVFLGTTMTPVQTGRKSVPNRIDNGVPYTSTSSRSILP
jgi:uncharacterized membrane protein